MSKCIQIISTILRVMTGLAFVALMVVVMVQVVMRTFWPEFAPVWTEEFARFALLYIVAFGAGLSLWTGAMVNVDMLCERLPSKLAWCCRLISALSICVFTLMLISPAWFFTKNGMMQKASSMPSLKMGYIKVSVLVLLLMLALAAALRVIGMLSGKLNGLPELRDEEEAL